MEAELAAAGKKKRRSKADLHTDAKKSLENKKQQLQKSHECEEGLRSALADSEGLVARMLEALCEAEEAAEAANTRLSQRLMELEPFGDEALRGKAIFRRKQLMEEVKQLQEDAKAPEAQHEMLSTLSRPHCCKFKMIFSCFPLQSKSISCSHI